MNLEQLLPGAYGSCLRARSLYSRSRIYICTYYGAADKRNCTLEPRHSPRPFSSFILQIIPNYISRRKNFEKADARFRHCSPVSYIPIVDVVASLKPPRI